MPGYEMGTCAKYGYFTSDSQAGPYLDTVDFTRQR